MESTQAKGKQTSTQLAEDAPPAKLSLPPSLTERLPTAAAAPSSAATPAPSSTIGQDADDREIGKRLIVGKGIQLKGEITACDRLVVEGQVEVTMNGTRTLEIKPSGHFIGSCEVEEAEVSGIYYGDLTVRGRLVVHHNGRATGKICYGQLELERGGQIAGELSVRERKQSQSAPQTRPIRAEANGRNLRRTLKSPSMLTS
jgi:cytoskeletal protein CcmA (bactofilin family)